MAPFRSLRRAALPLLFVLPSGGRVEGVAAQQPSTWRVESEPVFEVGAVDGPGAVLFTRIETAVFLPGGRVAVADGGERRIVVLEADGAVASVAGRAGEGPGEFGSVRGLWPTEGGGFAVWDARLRRVTRFDPSGAMVSTRPIDFGVDGAPVRGALDASAGAMSDGSFVLAWVQPEGGGGDRAPVRDRPLRDRMVYGLFDPDGRFRRLVGEGLGRVRMYFERGGGPVPLSPFPWVGLVADTLVLGNGADATLRFFAVGEDEMRPARVLRLPIPRPEGRAAWRAVRDLADAGALSPLWTSLVEQADPDAAPVPSHGRFFFDGDGRIWVKSFEAVHDALAVGGGPLRTGGEWTVFETDGTAVATVRFAPDRTPIAVEGDRVLALARDEFDVERVMLLRLLR